MGTFGPFRSAALVRRLGEALLELLLALNGLSFEAPSATEESEISSSRLPDAVCRIAR